MLKEILKSILTLLKGNKISYGSIFDTPLSAYEFKSNLDYKNIPKARHSFNENGFQYHQPYVNTNSCSAHGTGGALSDLVGEEFNLMDFKEIWQQEVSKGNASPAWGGYTWKMIDAWREWWNKTHPDDQVRTVSIQMGSDLMYDILEKGYSIAMGYTNHIGYNEDWMSDNLINKEWDPTKSDEDYGVEYASGHCLRLAKTSKYSVKGTDIVNIDNYKHSENRIIWNSNVYGIDKNIIPELVSKGIWHGVGYIFVFEKDLPVPIEQIIDQKLTARFENRIIFNVETQRFAVIKDGIKIEFDGKDMSELFKIKWANGKDSYVCGVTNENYKKIGKLINN